MAELRPRHPHVVRLVSRPANIEGAGGVELRDLVRQALRMRPDRLVVGEVRGAEVCELLAALNTGHDGGAGTVHANSAQEVPARMEALASTGGLSRAALHSQLAAAVQVVLHMRRLPTGQRVLDAVGVLTAADTGSCDRSGCADPASPANATSSAPCSPDAARRCRGEHRPPLADRGAWPASRTGSPPTASPPLWPSPRPRNPRSWRFGGPVVVGAVTGLLTAGPGGALAGALLAITVARARADRAARTAATTGATELADALRRITDELRAGSHPAVALAGVTADGPVAARLLTPAATAARLGDDVPAALRRGQDTAVPPPSSAAWPRPGRWPSGTACRSPTSSSASTTTSAGGSASAPGSRPCWRGPRATAGVLTALPGLGVALGQLLGADPIGVLRGGPLGQVLLVVGLGLVAAGRAWTEQILRRAVPR